MADGGPHGAATAVAGGPGSGAAVLVAPGRARRGGSGHGTAAAAPLTAWTPDVLLCVALATIVSLGLVLVYSAGAVYAARVHHDPQYFIKSQLVRVAVGLVGLVLAVRVPGPWLRRRCGWLYVTTVLLCAVVLVPGVGRLAGGARRWLVLGPATVQPSELAKLVVVILLAALLARRSSLPVLKRRSLLVPIFVAQLPVMFILAEPDLGTALVLELILGVMVLVAGLSTRRLLLLGLAALPVLYHLIVGTPFRLRRVLGYIDPWAYRQSVGYQVTEALISLGSGGVQGVGLGQGKHKLFFLPEAHTDFIFAILGEELGFVGVLALLLAFSMLIWRGLHFAIEADNDFDRYLALGLTALIAIPVVFNTCVATGLLPTKGLPLPLVSYGGSNVVATFVAIGLLLRIDRDNARAGLPPAAAPSQE